VGETAATLVRSVPTDLAGDYRVSVAKYTKDPDVKGAD
jgi:hypothetical protein